jgi:hypothetical protein
LLRIHTAEEREPPNRVAHPNAFPTSVPDDAVSGLAVRFAADYGVSAAEPAGQGQGLAEVLGKDRSTAA